VDPGRLSDESEQEQRRQRDQNREESAQPSNERGLVARSRSHPHRESHRPEGDSDHEPHRSAEEKQVRETEVPVQQIGHHEDQRHERPEPEQPSDEEVAPESGSPIDADGPDRTTQERPHGQIARIGLEGGRR
jgi:hypothetical protein